MVEATNCFFFFFLRFCGARATLCGDRRGRGASSRFFALSALPARPSAGIGVVEVQTLAFLQCADEPSAGIGVVEVQNSRFFFAFLRCQRDPLGGSAWSRCKSSRFLAFLRCADEPSAGIVRVDVLSQLRLENRNF